MIDLPIKNGDFFHSYVSHNQRVTINQGFQLNRQDFRSRLASLLPHLTIHLKSWPTDKPSDPFFVGPYVYQSS